MAHETTSMDFGADDAINDMLAEAGLMEPTGDPEDTEDEQDVELDNPEQDPDLDDEMYESDDPEDDDSDDEFEPDDDETEEESDEEAEPTAQTVEVNGEKISLDELKAGYLRQSDYTRKTQDLARQRTATAALEGLGTILASDPVKAAQITAIIQGKPLPQQQAQQQERPPEDPIERIKWEAKQEVLNALNPQLSQMKQAQDSQRQAAERQQWVQQQLAPYAQRKDFDAVRGEMNQMVAEVAAQKGLQAANAYYQRLDSDPAFFGQQFEAAGKRLAKTRKTAPKVKKKGSPRLSDSKGSRRTKKRQIKQAEIKAMRSGDPNAIFDAVAANGGFGDLFKG